MIAGEAGVPRRCLRLRLRTLACWLAGGSLAAAAMAAGPGAAAAAADRSALAAWPPSAPALAPAHHRHKPPPAPRSSPPICADDGLPALSPAEVTSLAKAAASVVAAPPSPPMTVAVVDRAGNVLGVYRQAGATGADDDLAIGLARTGAFFSNDQAPLSSRTVRFISGIHFPPGIANTPNAALSASRPSRARRCRRPAPSRAASARAPRTPPAAAPVRSPARWISSTATRRRSTRAACRCSADTRV